MIAESQWLVGGAGKMSTVVVEVVMFIAVSRFRIWSPSGGKEHFRQVCLQQRVVLVHRVRSSCGGVSMGSTASRSKERSTGIVESRCPRRSLKCWLLVAGRNR